VALLPVGPPVGRFGINPAEDAFLNLAPSNSLQVQINPEPVGLNRRGGKIGRVDEHLAGNTANIEAGPTKGAHLDQRDTEVIESLIDDRVPGPGANNAKVEVLHAAIVPAST